MCIHRTGGNHFWGILELSLATKPSWHWEWQLRGPGKPESAAQGGCQQTALALLLGQDCAEQGVTQLKSLPERGGEKEAVFQNHSPRVQGPAEEPRVTSPG